MPSSVVSPFLTTPCYSRNIGQNIQRKELSDNRHCYSCMIQKNVTYDMELFLEKMGG